ncbi:MAG: molybdopterin-binding protein [Anaerolineales bacterium]|nr:molybdopterin-binding protein [Anaerolineales bacterium]
MASSSSKGTTVMNKDPIAEIIAIGSELVTGHIVDTNSSHLARTLIGLGIDICFITAVGDDEALIADAVKRGLSRSDVVLTTGGLGPTVDDKTRAAVALATDTSLVFRPELLEQIKSRFAQWGRGMSQNNHQQAYTPEGALAIENPVGTAPCFIANHSDSRVICLPGVPREMTYLLEREVIPYLLSIFPFPKVTNSRVLHTVGLGESVVDTEISDLLSLESPQLGLLAHSGVVDIKITATASDEAQTDQLIGRVEGIARERLGEAIFGADEDTLELVVLNQLEALGYTVAVVESGTRGQLAEKLAIADAGRGIFRAGVLQSNREATGELDSDLEKIVMGCLNSYDTDICIASMVLTGEMGSKIGVALLPAKTGELQIKTRSHGGPVGAAGEWSANLGLNLARTSLS